MNFRDVIEGMHRRDPGVKAGALVGSDGLTVEEWHAPADRCDLPGLCAEIVRIFRESDRIAAEYGLGAAGEVSLAGGEAVLFMRRVTEEYFLVVVASSGIVPGKCRFLLRQAARQARELL
jgi:predicted regulator of Ras-like GTPase activity (Roadblock/LC7/MglB family)